MRERLILETNIKNINMKIKKFSPLEYNLDEKIQKRINFEIKRLEAYILEGRTETLSELVIKNTYKIFEKNQIPLKGINILGQKCRRSYLVDTNCNFYVYKY